LALSLVCAAVVVAVLPGVGPGASAWAAEMGTTKRHGTSIAPFWKVGDPDAALSRLCRIGQFNQKRHDSLYIGYYGLENPGRGYTGVAKKGYNLIDPTAQAEAKVTYHFFNDGFSNCKVYKADDPPSDP